MLAGFLDHLLPSAVHRLKGRFASRRQFSGTLFGGGPKECSQQKGRCDGPLLGDSSVGISHGLILQLSRHARIERVLDAISHQVC